MPLSRQQAIAIGERRRGKRFPNYKAENFLYANGPKRCAVGTRRFPRASKQCLPYDDLGGFLPQYHSAAKLTYKNARREARANLLSANLGKYGVFGGPRRQRTGRVWVHFV